ncbi:Putative uncharacterized protein [Propionibacterium freudenreichii]|uniref:Shedu immune nuclease family protein n=1 Tax=Propionibacterium freudenreichii TaxID=1744 RepID=UPI0005A5CB32|nr:Shedu immune nuclease family protein [Propionibacterium freudenreichii]CEI26746.1 Putative uncharacterized protein [Propionibacterium freudenreichii]SBN95888.1 Putative lysogenic conversion protein [Propionibacterium freudenreichii]SCC97474.1 Putative lysogenic conversion protein [Propionibacterium freudenreichii]
MINFEDRGTQVVLSYESEWGPVTWVDDKLRTSGEVTLSHTFTMRSADLLSVGEDDEKEDIRAFIVGSVGGEYRSIRDDVLGLKHDLHISKSLRLTKSLFVAERNISIFRRIDELVDEPIIIGGAHPSAIPVDEFNRLLRTFPTTTEMKLYAWTRITRVLREYMGAMTDAEQLLADHMARRARSKSLAGDKLVPRLPAAKELELAKFEFVRRQLSEMLHDAEAFSEAEWQQAVADLFLLIFPQYVAVLSNVLVKERYSNPGRETKRYIDLLLVSANGEVDVIEIKKPFERSLVSRSRYRDNHVPVRELSGAIIQAEKYLFYLNKSGQDGEMYITETYRDRLPSGLEIRITNPKAFVLSGRDSNLSTEERADFDFARRGYSNVVDIISYDDLLRRLDNVISSLHKRGLT